MSAFEFYKEKGFTPVNKSLVVHEGAAVAAWTPTTSTRIVVTDLSLSANNGSTIVFYWGNVGGSKIAEFLLNGSASITPSIGCWKGTAYDRSLFARMNPGHTAGMHITLTGFELT